MVKAGTKPLNMNIDASLLERIEKYRFKREFQSRTDAIEFLLNFALKQNPDPKKEQQKPGQEA